jgi:hypothetical protein
MEINANLQKPYWYSEWPKLSTIVKKVGLSLRKAFREIKLGYGDEMIKLADKYSGRQKDGSYRSNEFDSGSIIDCLDFSDTRTVADITNDSKEISKLAPVFGPYLGYAGLTCKYLPVTKPLTITSIALTHQFSSLEQPVTQRLHMPGQSAYRKSSPIRS